MEEIKDKILAEYEKGNIVVATIEGLGVTKLADFIQQPADGILYDLNRVEPVVLTFLPDPKWVNDFAVAKTIRALKDYIFELEKPKENYGWTKAEMRSILEDVVTALDLSESMLEKHGPLGTTPDELVRLVLEQKDKEIAMLRAGMTKIDSHD